METVKSLAAFFAEHGDDCLAQKDIKDLLLSLKGIGKWTAGYILMRTSASHDHWPEGDLILRKALSNGKAMIAHVVAGAGIQPVESIPQLRNHPHLERLCASRHERQSMNCLRPRTDTRGIMNVTSIWQKVVKEVIAMDPKSDAPKAGEQPLSGPIEHITGAHQLLTAMSEKLGAIHPELNEAITKLELALSALTVNTGGMF